MYRLIRNKVLHSSTNLMYTITCHSNKILPMPDYKMINHDVNSKD